MFWENSTEMHRFEQHVLSKKKKKIQQKHHVKPLHPQVHHGNSNCARYKTSVQLFLLFKAANRLASD